MIRAWDPPDRAKRMTQKAGLIGLLVILNGVEIDKTHRVTHSLYSCFQLLVLFQFYFNIPHSFTSKTNSVFLHRDSHWG